MHHQLVAIMIAVFRGEVVVQLPRTLNNAEYERPYLARRVISFQFSF